MTVSLILRDAARIGIAEHDAAGLGVLQWFHSNVPAYSMDHATTHEGYAVQEVDEVDCHEVADLIGAICNRVGVTMESTFVPFSQSRNAKPAAGRPEPWRSLNWRVTIKRHGREILSTDYAQGEGHAPAYKRKLKATTRYDQAMKNRAISHEIETGRAHEFGEGMLFGADGTRDTRKPIPAPSIGEVLQSLARDSDVLDAGGFEDWAAEYGYEVDSRSAEAIYRACIEIATKLRAGLGPHLLAEIRLAASFN